MDWELLNAQEEGQVFLDLVQDCFLFPKVTEPSRGYNILDLIFTSEVGMKEDIEVIEPLGTRDHNIIVF